MRGLVVDVLDLAGGLLLVSAAAVLAWRLDPAAGLAAAGTGVLVISWLGERSARPQRVPRRPALRARLVAWLRERKTRRAKEPAE